MSPILTMREPNHENVAANFSIGEITQTLCKRLAVDRATISLHMAAEDLSKLL